MTFEEAKTFVHATGNVSRLGLERMNELLGLIGNPEKSLKFVHVAGTNGKGSTSAMTASILKEAGYKTGLYISPHLTNINERIQINGQMIPDTDFAALADIVAPAIAQMSDSPTEFERITAMALLYFSQKNCSIVVLEVGLGGRLDATNIIESPEVSVLTSIDFDHTEWLGDTLEKIAFEKGGIIKPGCPVVLYHQTPDVEKVIHNICSERKCSLRITADVMPLHHSLDGQVFTYRSWENVSISLLGLHQQHNASTVLETVEALRERGWEISDDAVYCGMKNAVWPARLEVLQKSPLVLLDGAHNPNGVEALASSLRKLLPQQKFTLVMGVMADKDYNAMLLHLSPLAMHIIAAQPDYYRALSSKELSSALDRNLAIPVYDGGCIPEALALAHKLNPSGPICVFGSLYQAGEVRAFYGKASSDKGRKCT